MLNRITNVEIRTHAANTNSRTTNGSYIFDIFNLLCKGAR